VPDISPVAATALEKRTPVQAGLRAAILEGIHDAVIATDRRGRIIYWNDAAARLYGWRADEVLGRPVFDVTVAQSLRDSAAEIMKRLRAGETWSGELVVQDREGRAFPVRVTDSPIRDQDGKLVGIVGVSRDISGEADAEAARLDSERRLDLVRRAAGAILWEWDPAADRVQWNASAEQVFGYDTATMGTSRAWWSDRIHPDDRDRVATGLDDFLSGSRRHWTDEYRFRTASGTHATVFERAFVERDEDGVPVRLTGTLVDLTERRKLHEERRLLAQASMILDLSLDFEATVPTVARLVTHSVAEACLLYVQKGGARPAFVSAAHVDPRRQGLMEELAALLSDGLPVGGIAERVMRSGDSLVFPLLPERLLDAPELTGRLREVVQALDLRSAVIVPLRARKTIVGVAVLGRSGAADPFEEEDLQVAEELGRRIGLAVDHTRLYERAELANRAKSDFLAVMSHELRTPLTAVLGYSDLLSDQVCGPLNAAQQKQVSRIQAGSERLLQLIEGILAFVRLETGDARPHYERVDPNAIIQRVEEIIGPRAADEGVEFTVRMESLPDTVCTDPDKVAQILLALLANGLKFTDGGAIALTARAEGDDFVMDVQDSGGGIADEHLPYVFNAFWQAEQPSTRRAGGAGLGLSVARRTARLLDGDVTVAETSPIGTTFRLTVPLEP
jgi:PAS domain S-box-containing protein